MTVAIKQVCARCGGSFEPRRSTARYCSTACRMADHRAPRAPRRALSVTPGIGAPKVSVPRPATWLGPVSRPVPGAPSADLARRAACREQRMLAALKTERVAA